MDREEAAAVLGVSVRAPRAQVQIAFRRALREAHPDIAGGSGADVDRITTARDVLLQPPATAAEPAARPSPTPSRTRPNTQRSVWPFRILGIIVIGALVAVAAVLIWTLASGVERTSDPDVGIDECVIVTPDDVTDADCDAFGAQRVVGELSGARQCPAGSNSLVAGSTTWCLMPADG